jgi:hypothetical protein
MKTRRFRSPRDPVVAYGALMKNPGSNAKLDAAQIHDLAERIETLQRQLKALQRRAERRDDTDGPSDPPL